MVEEEKKVGRNLPAWDFVLMVVVVLGTKANLNLCLGVADYRGSH